MRLFLFSLSAALALFCATARAGEAKWLADYSKAIEQAKTENKVVLLDFTGSDWCGWCMKMKEEALDKPAFKHYAAKNLVLVEVDFPHNKSQASKVKEQNKTLSQKFNVHGYPCFVLVDKNEKELGRQGGYLAGGAKAFIDKLNTFYTPAPESSGTKTGSSDFDSFFKKP
jgi:protein disulfide-isomerase